MRDRLVKVLSLVAVCVLLLVQGCSGTRAGARPDAGLEGDQAPEVAAQAEAGLAGPVEAAPFTLGPGDKIEISVYRNDDLRMTVQIDPSGRISFPFVGDVQAAGLSIFELRDRLRDGLSKYIVEPQVNVNVTSVQSQKIMVLGEVKSPGFFQMDNMSLTAIEAVSRAGGFTLDGKQTSVVLVRGKKAEVLDLTLRDGGITGNVTLQRGDIVYVPRTTIANLDRFFKHLSAIISPFLQLETGYFVGQQIERGGSTVISTQ